jgi:hypothetical protein
MVSIRAFMPLLLLIITSYATEPFYVAVNDLVGKGITKTESEIITDKIRNELIIRKNFKVMERSEMNQIMEEMEFQNSGICDDQACAVEIGKIIGVDKIISGSIGKIGSMFSINIKMVDVSTAEIKYSVSGEYTCTIEELLSKYTVKLVNKLENQIFGDKGGTISITTTPPSGNLTITGTDVNIKDITPYKSPILHTGDYAISIKLNNYELIKDSITVNTKEALNLTYQFKHTKAFTDSIAHLSKKGNRKKKVARQVTLGLLGAAAAGGGIYFNSKINDNISDREIAYKNYQDAKTEEDAIKYRNKVESLDDDIKMNQIIRNSMYGVGGAFGLTFTITMFF